MEEDYYVSIEKEVEEDCNFSMEEDYYVYVSDVEEKKQEPVKNNKDKEATEKIEKISFLVSMFSVVLSTISLLLSILF